MNLIHENKPVSLQTFTYELNPARVKQRWVVHALNQGDTAYSNPSCFISNESPQILYPLKSTQIQNTVILIYSSLHAMFTQRIKGLSRNEPSGWKEKNEVSELKERERESLYSAQWVQIAFKWTFPVISSLKATKEWAEPCHSCYNGLNLTRITLFSKAFEERFSLNIGH